MVSPITGTKENVEVYAQFNGKDIVDLYRDKLDIDVQRYFTEGKSVTLYKCTTTGLKFFSPQLEGDERLYKELQAIKGDNYYSKWKWENDVAMSQISQNDLVLDVGCGNGVFLEKVKSLNIKGFGIEFNNEAVKACRAKGLEVGSIDINEYVKEHNDFDVICAFQVLEHVADVQGFVNGMLKGLKKGGKLILGTPNNNPYLFKQDRYHTLNLPPHHVGLWNAESYKSLEAYFPMKLSEVKIEPLYAFHYWTKIQLEHLFPKYSTAIQKILNLKLISYGLTLIGKVFQNNLQGRNIVAIFEKN